MTETSALVLFSGGQDSTACLGWALERFDKVATIGFNYGQRHSIELECRQQVLDRLPGIKPEWTQRLSGDNVINMDLFKEIGGSALTDDLAIEMGKNNLPTSFVPGRNLVFLCVAAALAYRLGHKNIVLGVCETDYSGYPDCRDDTVKAMQVALNLGMETRFIVHTPLMWLDKAATWGLIRKLGGPEFLTLVCEHTHTCYEGVRGMRQDWGYGCGTCPACELRAQGWERFIQEAGGL